MSEPIDMYDPNNAHIRKMAEIADRAIDEIEKDGRLFSPVEKQALKLYFLQYLAHALDVTI